MKLYGAPIHEYPHFNRLAAGVVKRTPFRRSGQTAGKGMGVESDPDRKTASFFWFSVHEIPPTGSYGYKRAFGARFGVDGISGYLPIPREGVRPGLHGPGNEFLQDRVLLTAN